MRSCCCRSNDRVSAPCNIFIAARFNFCFISISSSTCSAQRSNAAFDAVANHARTIPSTRYASIVRVLAIPGYDLSQTVKIQQQLCHSLRQTRCGSHGWTLHSIHGVSQQQQLTCLQQACCSLQQLERGYATRPHVYNARHHDAHALHSSQRAWLDTAQRSWRVTTAAVDLFTASMFFTAARTRPCIATTRLQCATS